MRELTLALAVLCGLARSAAAFQAGAQFDLDPVMYDGAGGIAFTGAPRWTAHDCSVCHTNPPGLISIELEADHPELFTSGYTPGMQYLMRVVMLGEHEGTQYAKYGNNCGFAEMPYVPCDNNGFALEFDDTGGTPKGAYATATADGSACATGSASPTADAYILADGTAALHSGATAAETAWSVCWTAPKAGTGTVIAYVALVDGNGGDGTMNFSADTIGDDVAVGQVAIVESGAAATNNGGGCNAGNGPAGLGAIALVLLGVVRRRRAKQLALLALLVAFAIGCVHVRPRERETLAKRAMKFSPDPAEDELDLHMQEAREGASGGYGTAGGGCGCN